MRTVAFFLLKLNLLRAPQKVNPTEDSELYESAVEGARIADERLKQSSRRGCENIPEEPSLSLGGSDFDDDGGEGSGYFGRYLFGPPGGDSSSDSDSDYGDVRPIVPRTEGGSSDGETTDSGSESDTESEHESFVVTVDKNGQEIVDLTGASFLNCASEGV